MGESRGDAHRSLSPGDRIGPYQVIAPVGAGGMGEVYRARDDRLHRDVAIKIVSSRFALDAARQARFAREAQILAALNHPNIATLYGLEEVRGLQALVLELVEGENLADRLASQPTGVRLQEAVGIAQQMAAGLEAAHESGIVHRDLKPANIALRPDGTVKLLDFGLARALESTAGSDPAGPTITVGETGIGTVIGTPAYMSPEQARGQTTDKRTDIWSFGVVLYEMLTGRDGIPGPDDIGHDRGDSQPRAGLANTARDHTRPNSDAAATMSREGFATAAARHRRRADRARCPCRVTIFIRDGHGAWRGQGSCTKGPTRTATSCAGRRGRRADCTGLRGSRLVAAADRVIRWRGSDDGVTAAGSQRYSRAGKDPLAGIVARRPNARGCRHGCKRPTALSANPWSARGHTSGEHRGGLESVLLARRRVDRVLRGWAPEAYSSRGRRGSRHRRRVRIPGGRELGER